MSRKLLLILTLLGLGWGRALETTAQSGPDLPGFDMTIASDLAMVIDAADLNGFQATERDRTTLDYLLKVGGSQSLYAKIVVETSCPGQRFGMAVVAENPSSGVPAPPVDLMDGMMPSDFVVDILIVSLLQSVELAYAGSASMDQGVGIDRHTVTYTILDQ